MTNNQAISCPVNSHNEWDTLEEVVVGCLYGSVTPEGDPINRHTLPPGVWDMIEEMAPGGVPYPDEVIEPSRAELEEFVHILESEGVIVRRADTLDYNLPFSTPAWRSEHGFSAANPRDPFIVIGNEIIEAPMADRNRYFEGWAYRSLFKEYFKAGAKWVAAPKPQLLDAQYDLNYKFPKPGEEMRYVVTEFEPTFDAADFVRCGQDIFCQKSQVTNELGIMWLQRHLGDPYRIHVIDSPCIYPMHIDTTLMPLAPGKVMVNPENVYLDQIKSLFKGWDVLVAPPPVNPTGDPLGDLWANVNVLMLDEERVIVEETEEPTINVLKDWGFKPIPCAFQNYYSFAGSFHCATLDVRRRGVLKSYF